MKEKKKPDKNKVTHLQRYLSMEIGIEFKACLYFFCILFFYCMFRMLRGSFEASILHMAEMIFTTYFMGYIQILFLSNFDEAEKLGCKEVLYSLFCSLIYTGVAFWGKWFDKNIPGYAIFLGYIEFAYLCAFLVYKVKREIDTRVLNENLRTFQERRDRNE